MRAPSLFIMIAIVFTGACDRSTSPFVAPDAGGMSLGGSGQKTVPFEARYDFHLVPGPVELCAGSATITRTYGAGEGVGTQLGRFTVTASQCALPGGITAEGRGTYVAASGELLYFTYTGYTTLEGLVLTFHTLNTFAGGTGRFAGATGTANAVGSVDLSTGKAWADWEGDISSVGSPND